MKGPQTEIEQSPIDDLVRPDIFSQSGIRAKILL